ncbi:MAG: RNA polymerase sigma-54 factor [Robiginitomaculum sp.]|nr:MAG: RNA polymerase sigma-54 factor [Robiginitomaculum sp.]
MGFGQRLEVRQGQSLVMTPQLQQAIKLLQMSNFELSAYVEDELLRNPLLERSKGDGQDGEGAEPPVADHTEASLGEVSIDTESSTSTKAAADAVDADFESTYATSREDAGEQRQSSTDRINSMSGSGGGMSGAESISTIIEQTATRDKTLAEHLSEQLALTSFDPKDRLMAAGLIALVDDDGYLRIDIGQEAARLGVSAERLGGILKTLQSFEPTGVMARDLPECLALQLIERDRFDPAMQAMIENLDLLARHDLEGLKACCGVDAEDLTDMVGELRALTPKPGQAFCGETAAVMVPDVIVGERPDGGWTVELNTETLPRVLVNQRYYAEVNASLRNDEEKTFISECHQNASWLVKSLDQRARTILKVSRELVRQQDGFLAHGIEHLRPLNLRAVADAIEMHESTVSRVTSNKFIQTPRGLFELKYFFTAAIASMDGGEAHSAEAVRHRIKGMIAHETLAEVLSDDRIVEMLAEAGIDIARRTVAKYREAMRIPSSVQRRRILKQSI